MRDTQRARLYRAEQAVTVFQQTIPDREVQAFVDKVLGLRVVRNRWGKRSVRVVLTSGRRAYYHPWSDKITVSRTCRTEMVLLHEIAHALTPDHLPSHGTYFAWTYLFLVKAVLGKEQHDRLRGEMREQRVRVRRPAMFEMHPDMRRAA